MENIKIYDKLINEEDMKKCKEFIRKPKWNFQHVSIEDNSIFNIPFWDMDLNKYPFFTVYLKKKIEDLVDKKFELLRVYATGHTYAQGGRFHRDSEEAKHYTFCLYINSIDAEKIEEAGGNIQFKLEGCDYNIGIETPNNRGILFPSNYVHKANAYNRFFTELRICIAWKLKEI